MKHWFALAAIIMAATFFAACDEDTGTMGIVTSQDAISSYSNSFEIVTNSLLLDSVVGNTSKSYLGQVYDGETGTDIRAEFLAQFHTFENYVLPDYSSMIKNADGEVEADSVDVRLYFTDYFGEATNPMKVLVYELDTTNVIREDVTYYATDDLSRFLPENAQPLASHVFSPSDYTLLDVERTSATHYNNVRIRLPKSFGTRILRQAFEHPSYFQDSWQFIHHVFPGFYFKLHSGIGTMLTLDVSALNVYFRYVDKDSTYVGVSRFSATPEVIQSTTFQNMGLQRLIQNDKPYTYLKSPAGIATELTLPVNDIFAGHETDSVARARIILTRCNEFSTVQDALSIPSNLLLLPKSQLHSFFVNHQVADGVQTYTTSFSSANNTYTFENVSRLLAHLYREKQRCMTAERLTSAQYDAKYPDWNHVVVVPVTIATTTDSSTGLARQTSVNHDFSLTSTRLVGGSKPIDMQVIYSSYQ